MEKITQHDISEQLIYEIIDGKAIYYKDYQKVIDGNKQSEGIMGSSGLQAYIIDCIVKYFHIMQYLNPKLQSYQLLYNEVGLHLGESNNLALDIAIYEKSTLLGKLNRHYLQVAPQAIIEVDTKADLNDFDETIDYIKTKTQKLVDFGCQKVYWILSENQMIIEAISNQPWQMSDWNTKISPLANFEFILADLIQENGML